MKNYDVKNFVGMYNNAIVLDSKEGIHLESIDTGKYKPVTIGKRLKGKAYFISGDYSKDSPEFPIYPRGYTAMGQYNKECNGYFVVILHVYNV